MSLIPRPQIWLSKIKRLPQSLGLLLLRMFIWPPLLKRRFLVVTCQTCLFLFSCHCSQDCMEGEYEHLLYYKYKGNSLTCWSLNKFAGIAVRKTTLALVTWADMMLTHWDSKQETPQCCLDMSMGCKKQAPNFHITWVNLVIFMKHVPHEPIAHVLPNPPCFCEAQDWHRKTRNRKGCDFPTLQKCWLIR